jgi:hypothetical protein
MQYWDNTGASDFEIQLVIVLIWFFWFATIITNLILLLNFLIAVISQEYDFIIAQQLICQYFYKAEFNYEYSLIMKFL